jgi:hypothetical protein
MTSDEGTPSDPQPRRSPNGDSDSLPRLDIDQAIDERVAGQPSHPPRPRVVIDTFKYQRRIAGVGILVVIVFLIYLQVHTTRNSSAIGIPAGQKLPRFVAPLATSQLNGVPSNAHPVCDPARPARHGLNVCGRQTLVLGLFALKQQCIKEVDTMQRIAPRFPTVKFAAVAVNANRGPVRALVRSHHWTIPIAYDVTGIVGEQYRFAVCPLVELVQPGGVVQRRLIGYPWESTTALAGAVTKLAGPRR